MKFYAYKWDVPLGTEPLGTDGKLLFELKTVRGAMNRCKRYLKTSDFRLYTYTNFYDDKTFKQVKG